MKCPKCGYVRTDADSAPSYECPSCGVIYDKVKIPTPSAGENQASFRPAQPSLTASAQAPARSEERGALGACEDCGGTVSKRAVECPHCGLPFAHRSRPVTIVDFKMEFESMVWFIVKWTIAAIPAVVILVIIALVLLALVRAMG